MKTYLWGGQSNGTSEANLAQLTGSPPSGASLARLWFYQEDAWDYTDDVGQFVPLVFDPGQIGTPSNGYDWPPNEGQPPKGDIPFHRLGPEVYGGIALADFHATDILNVKLSPPGTQLAPLKRVLPGVDQSAGWFNAASHQSWSIDYPRNVTPYTVASTESGTATGVTASTLTDTSKTWVPQEHAGSWVTMDDSLGFVIGNTATVLFVFVWRPTGKGVPALGAYTVERRQMTPASLAKHLIEGYLAGAVPAAVAIGETVEVDGFFWTQGETDAIDADADPDFETARAYKRRLLDLIWYVRETVFGAGLSAALDTLKWVLARLKPGSVFWSTTTAAIIRQAHDEITDADPNCGSVSTASVTLGGTTGSDQIHYNADGQKTLGQLMGAEMIRLTTSPHFSRKSHTYYGQHIVVRPVWGIKVAGRLARHVASRVELLTFPAETRTAPLFYLMRDGAEGSVPVYLSEDGREMNNSSGTLLGYAWMDKRPGTVDLSALAISDFARPRLFRGQLGSEMAKGYVWLAGDGSGDFHEREKVVESGASTHTIQLSMACSGLPKRWMTNSDDWLLRGASGQFGVNAQLRVQERVGQNDHFWMRHHITWCGDYRTPQKDGLPTTGLAPTIGVDLDGPSWRGTSIPMEWACDVDAPPNYAESGATEALSQIQVTHDAVAANYERALWPNVLLANEMTPNWHGIAGVFRIVWSLTPAFDLGSSQDTLIFEPTVWCNGDVMTEQVSYSPAQTAYGYDFAQNYYLQFTAQDESVFDAGSLVSSSAATIRRGAFGWETGSGVSVCLYGDLGRSSATIGNKPKPLPPTYPGYASVDQINYAFLRQSFTLQGATIQAGTTLRYASFLIVGSEADVQAATAALDALGVDETWVD